MTEPRIVETEALLLSRDHRDRPGGIEIALRGVSPAHGAVEATFGAQEAVFFVPRVARAAAPVPSARRESRPLRGPDGRDVDALYFASYEAARAARESLREALVVPLESDVRPSERFLMERFVTAGVALRGPAFVDRGVLRFRDPKIRPAEVRPALRLLSLDIETDGLHGPVLSIALAGEGYERVFVHGAHPDRGEVTFHRAERAVLDAAFAAIRDVDPDVIVGWNVVDFDLAHLAARAAALDLPFAIARGGERARILSGDESRPAIARVPGRVVLDGIALLRSATYGFERYGLDHVARALLGRGKKIAEGVDPVAEIRRMHADDPLALAAYNLEDCRLVLDVFRATDLVAFAVERAYLTGLPIDRQGGSVAAFDHLYLPRLHRRGYVAPDVGGAADARPSPGGYVLESVPGLYRNVLAFDFRSLYPSIIRTFRIDPLGLWAPGDDPVPGFDGARFAREGAILPEVVATLAAARGRALAAGDEPLQRAIKILMNSLYGVLGSSGCRFFDPRMASSITLRGHEIIERSRALFEAKGLPVLYGDTDSLFVRLADDLDEAACRAEGARLAAETTAYFRDAIAREHRLESHLELRFDAHYLRFLMPTMRGSARGSKKRYAGLVRAKDGAPAVVVRGLEAVRSDWTELAREVQRELLRRVFVDAPFEAYLRGVRDELVAGTLDEKLVYRRRLRRDADDYEGNPPHVRAARMLEGDESAAEVDAVEYVITTRGPEPARRRTAPIDYAHYLARQLAPAADVVLPFLGTSFDAIAGEQLRLF